MSEVQEEKKTGFAQLVKPPEDVEVNKADETVKSAQQKVLDGLKDQMADTTLENIRNLAPRDEFTIAGEEYKRQKITPKNLRKLKAAERQYLQDIKQEFENPDDRQELDFKLLQLKAEIYLGMTQEQFDDTDIEDLQIVLQATELRTQGFRKRE